MKKLFLFSLLLIPIYTLEAVELKLPTDVTAFTKIGEIVLSQDIVVPTPAELQLPADFNSSLQVAVVSDGTSTELINSEIINEAVTISVPINIFSDGNILTTLTDNILSSTADFAVENDSSTRTELKIEALEPIQADGIKFDLAKYGILPNTISITAKSKSGNAVLVLSTTKLLDNSVRFPKLESTSWTVIFNHSQPLKLAELGLIPSQPKITYNNKLLFLALPKTNYKIYFNPETQINLPFIEGSVFSNNTTKIPASIISITTNPYYVSQDTDNDGIKDKNDNCPSLANPDQLDVDKNNAGDACEDFDRDGIMNLDDNCRDTPNRSQKNKDADDYGDECDDKDNRFTEQNPLVPLFGLLLSATAIGLMFIQVRRQKITLNKNQSSPADTETKD